MQVVHQGSVSAQAPLGPVTEARLRSSEVHEGASVELLEPLPCSVAFSRGQERSVLLAAHGMPRVRQMVHILDVLFRLHPHS